MTAPSQLRVLTLHEKEHSSTIFRLEKGWSLHFRLGPSLADKEVHVFVNHPEQGKQGPNRHVFREVKWQSYSQHKEDVYDNYAEVTMVLAGSFNYFFTTDDSTDQANANGSGYFLVDPILKVGQYDEKVPLDSICCQTVLAKNMGPFSEWKDRLRVAKEAGYNMIHFTPIQELGLSNSAYCLKDQLRLNPTFDDSSVTYGYKDVEVLVNMMKDDWEVLSLTDLVFNHTANESPWIVEHPECAYNLINSPHLKPAYLLDRILWHFSSEVARGEWQQRGIPAELKTEAHLDNIQKIMSGEVLPKHSIHEYFVLDIDSIMKQFRSEIDDAHIPYKESLGSIEVIPDVQWRRLKATVDIPTAIQQFFASNEPISDKTGHVESSCDAFKKRLEELNRAKRDEVESHLAAAVKNLVANARYRFVDPNGEKLPKVLVDDEPIMWNYFTLPSETLSVAEEELRMHTAWGAHCMGHNGWVMGDDPLRNFAAPGSNVYLRRELIPWGDSVKLRYGEAPEDCPFLWQHMRDYVVETARVFHGVRLDNCHSTPIHVAEWMLDEARKVRPDLYVIAELFTNSEYMDNLFINRLGLNSLIREGLNAHSPHDLGASVHRFGGEPVGAFFQPPARPLVPSVAHAILFDQTHDNVSPVEKRSAYDVLPSAALIAMGCFATGSNRGYDEIVPHHINVVKKKKVPTATLR